EIFFAFDVVNDDVVGGTQDLEFLFDEIVDFERRIGKPVVIGGAESMVRSVFHAGGNFPARGRGDGYLDGALFAVDEIHPDLWAADEGMAFIVLRDIVL